MTTKPDTRHLDTAINILKGTGASKRAPRKAQVTITIHVGTDRISGERAYTLQANGKTVEEGLGDVGYARRRAEERADRIKGLGKTVIIKDPE